ncbi:MAG: hypothetical protein FJX95_08555 [Bacteroidetes bacterium]|nr:hypothetical protein [Bacteroidota bacterium]
MNQETLFVQLEANIRRLGESKQLLEDTLAKQKGELASLYSINKELQVQIDDLTEKLQNRNTPQILDQEPDQEVFKVKTQQRIQDLVKEIDECIALLNS